MLVRAATHDDFNIAMHFARQFHAEDPAYSSLPFVESMAADSIRQFIDSDNHCYFILTDSENRFYGFLMGHIAGSHFSPINEAHEDYLYVDMAARGSRLGGLLIDAFEEWANAKGVGPKNITIRSQINQHAAHRLVTSKDYVPWGTCYTKY